MGQHLPGPYAYDADDGSLQHVESGMEIASLSRVDDFPCRDTDKDSDFEAEIDATGRLLAAAPDLLSALREATDIIAEQCRTRSGTVARLLAAIAKAEGR